MLSLLENYSMEHEKNEREILSVLSHKLHCNLARKKESMHSFKINIEYFLLKLALNVTDNQKGKYWKEESGQKKRGWFKRGHKFIAETKDYFVSKENKLTECIALQHCVNALLIAFPQCFLANVRKKMHQFFLNIFPYFCSFSSGNALRIYLLLSIRCMLSKDNILYSNKILITAQKVIKGNNASLIEFLFRKFQVFFILS